MLRKTSLILTTLIFFSMLLAGCQSSNVTGTPNNEKVQKYYDARVSNLGDNSKVSALLEIIGAEDLGEYTIALNTIKEPYGLIINYSKLKNKGDAEKFENIGSIDYAYFALSLIENLSEIDINYKSNNYHLTRGEANEFVKGEIKDYGKTPVMLNELDQLLNPVD